MDRARIVLPLSPGHLIDRSRAAVHLVRKPDVDPFALKELIRRALPSGSWLVGRTETGSSTQVYRLSRGSQVLFLRIAEDRSASLAPEVLVHQLLRAKGAKVPDVVYFEPFDELLERSVAITTEIEGVSISHCTSPAEIAAVLRPAGRDLALINSVRVSGFGWIRRGTSPLVELAGEHSTHRAFMLDDIGTHLALIEPLLGTGPIESMSQVIESHYSLIEPVEARLAHGDFDAASIFQMGGRFTGVIDFGEIRGAHPLYDVAHFWLHEGETLPRAVSRFLVEGYREISPMPDDHERVVRLLGLLIGVKTLARRAGRQWGRYDSFLVETLRRLSVDL